MKKIFIFVAVIAVLLVGTVASAADQGAFTRGQGKGDASSEVGRFAQEREEQRMLNEECDDTCEYCEDGEEHFYGQSRDIEERGYGEYRDSQDCDYEQNESVNRLNDDNEQSDGFGRGRNSRN